MQHCKKHSFLLIIKVALILISAVFFAPSCANKSYPANKQIDLTQPRILSAIQTHKLLQKWSANDFKDLPALENLPKHQIKYKSHHPLAKNFTALKSGLMISKYATRSKGIGLACVIKKKTSAKQDLIRNFIPITKRAFVSKLHPANIVATQTLIKGRLSTQIDIYDPRSAKHKGRPLVHQHKIVIDYLNTIPGNSSLDIKGLLKPQKYHEHRGFYLSEPYDRRRIPILMIHGLASSPETFMEMSEAINADPALRKKYQTWYYFYPTGTPWIVSASNFRKSYRKLIKKLDPNKNDKNIRKTVIIGHSMGGLISRLSLSHPKKNLYKAYFGNTPLSQIFSGEKLKKIREYMNYKPLTEPEKVIFMATPHRGSSIADGFIGWATIKVITIPTFILKQTADVLTLRILERSEIPEQTKKLLTKGESSVDQLKPSNPALIALNHMLLRRKLKSHSIIGDIGLPFFHVRTDGVVSYRSAHIPNPSSEHVIASSHNICGDPDAIKAVIKILKQ